ncbi:MAG: MTAP family purine nucleoside phosphorylase [Actinomycetota bacterium]|nr:MTAP family purine nucleoside phosphorylase [Actinomycetota bacterium]
MTVAIVTGSGTHALPDFEDAEAMEVETPYGGAQVTRGRFADVDALHVSRHGEGHVRLSNHVNHRANVWALRELGARAVIGCTACGAVDGDLPLGTLVLFDDLDFPSNRLPGGELCTLFDEPGRPDRGHWISERPYCEPLRQALVEGAAAAGVHARDGGCYGHVDGPRFNTRTEIARLAHAGVTAVSQTGGPETVLCGEAQLPYALMGFATDYANGVKPAATPVDELIRLMGESTARFAAVLAATLPQLDAEALEPPGLVYRFHED